MKRVWAVSFSLLCFFLSTGCEDIQQETAISVPEQTVTTTAETTTMTTTTTTVTTTTTASGPSYPEETIEDPYITEVDTNLRLQAEDCMLSEVFTVENERSGYTGGGYVRGLSESLNNTISFSAELPSSQHYDISIIMAADTAASCTLKVDDTTYSTVSIPETGKFVQATIQGVYLEEGIHNILVQQETGEGLLDCILIQNSQGLQEITLASSTLSDPEATLEAKQLMTVLTAHYGKTILSGQYVSSADNEELSLIYQTTGQLPVIRFADLYGYSGNGGSPAEADAIASSLEWAGQGGIVGLMWHWNAPIGEASVYSDEVTFSLEDAVTSADIAHCNRYELQEMQKDGTISEECIALIEDIDAAASALKELQEAGIPVLWRPLHEASGGWFWWGASGRDAYQWLWDLMYTRMTEYHELHNLIWIWNGQSTDYLVPESQYDIASADIYLSASSNYGSRYEQFFALQELAGEKLVALSECSTVPELEAMLRDNAVWLFFGLWYGEYLLDPVEGYTTEEQLITAYNSDLVMTLEEYIAATAAYP